MASNAFVLSEHTVRRAVLDAGIGVPPRYLASTGSTNADLLEAAGRGAPAWTAEVAGHQDAGRGRLGRAWVEPPGSSLLVSVLLRPPLPPGDAPLLSLAAAAAMAAACRSAGVPASCKWPNDVLSRGRKLCGVLAESVVEAERLAHVVVGAGLNVAQTAGQFPEELRDLATSVRLEGGAPDPAPLLAAYLRELRALAADDRPEALRAAVLAAYRPRCVTLGLPVRALAGGAAVEGVAYDVGPSGELLLETPVGLRAIAHGEIEHLR